MDIRYFLGANSAAGFYSHYDQLLPSGKRTLRILKGGSGCGKSTLMKKVAAHAEQRGMTVHRIYCSSDPDSLDGILIPSAGYAVVDGTAPHVVEPELCGCGERYVDLGAGYDTQGLLSCRHILLRLKKAAQDSRDRASFCLSALAALEENAPPCGSPDLSLLDRVIPEQGAGGSGRTVFLSGHTPEGRLTFWDTVTSLCPDVYMLRGSMAEVTAFLRSAEALAAGRGWSRMICDSPLLPGHHMEHLLLPELGAAFVSDTSLSPCPLTPKRVLGRSLSDDGSLPTRQRILQKAIDHLKQAREYHDLLEEAYAPFVSFTAANRAALDCCAELETL